MHVGLQIGDDMIMGTDMLESLGQKLVLGNNSAISIHPDTKEETDRLDRDDLLVQAGVTVVRPG